MGLLLRLLLQDARLARVDDVDYLGRLVGDPGRVSRCFVFGHSFDSARLLHRVRVVFDYHAPAAAGAHHLAWLRLLHLRFVCFFRDV